NVLHIAEFMTVAKSLPHLWQKVRKLLIPKLFLSYSCIFGKNTTSLVLSDSHDLHLQSELGNVSALSFCCII
ncbi:hypothetical protein, partial [Bacteroides sp. L10-4]|uniref:hypothetical protein n=1 Tax=Bacteroides sp. L10-4 TaxID=2746063 RepID=UPI001C3E99FF